MDIDQLRQQLAALEPLERLAAEVVDTRERRDRLIVQLAQRGIALTLIADAAALSPSRVHQIVRAARPAGDTDGGGARLPGAARA